MENLFKTSNSKIAFYMLEYLHLFSLKTLILYYYYYLYKYKIIINSHEQVDYFSLFIIMFF